MKYLNCFGLDVERVQFLYQHKETLKDFTNPEEKQPKNTAKLLDELSKSVQNKQETPENVVRKKLAALESEYGILELGLGIGGKYDFEDLQKHILNIEEALHKIRDKRFDALLALRGIRLRIGEQGFFSPEDGVQKTKGGETLILFDYDEDPEEIANDIINGLTKLEKIPYRPN